KEARLNRVGCFKFEPVKGASANDLPGAVPEDVKQERYHRFMTVQQAISADLLKGWIGREIDVLIDEVDGDGAIGRSYADAPEIDGAVILEGETCLRPGDMTRARVSGADEYDLWAERLEK
ncbi:MAG TPA: 30S ribosomal protein S12 methylthiotransferase RimO, partial [Parvularcula sp.]|nr:30S ribosomal protein S12 methylthiotransferase RimO [Parvularcula sp.]